MVEFALIAPLLFLLVFVMIDFGRLVYTYTAISSASRDGVRTASLADEASSDCNALHLMEAVGQGFPLVADPASIRGNSDPDNPSGLFQPTTPPPGVGYIYIWPAVAAPPPDSSTGGVPNCSLSGGTKRLAPGNQQRDVAVAIEYQFKPLTPIVSSFINNFVIRTVAVEHVEY